MIIAISILSILLVISIFIITNLLRKVERLDDELLENIDNQFKVQIKLKEVFDTMKEIDSKGAFESDDEVGSVFVGIKEVLNNLQEQIMFEEKANE